MRRLALVALCLVSSAVATASAGAKVPASVREFSRLTLEYDQQRRAAEPRARGARDAIAAQAASCLEIVRAAPSSASAELGTLYELAVGGGLWSVDGPIARRWVERLERRRVVVRDAPLRAAVALLVNELRRADAVYGFVGGEFCASTEAWAAVGFDEARQPSAVRAVRAFELLVGDEVYLAPSDYSLGSRRLTRTGGAAGRRAARIVARGLNEPDRLIAPRSPRDPVAAALGFYDA